MFGAETLWKYAIKLKFIREFENYKFIYFAQRN